jgi:hypothetical protein
MAGWFHWHGLAPAQFSHWRLRIGDALEYSPALFEHCASNSSARYRDHRTGIGGTENRRQRKENKEPLHQLIPLRRVPLSLSRTGLRSGRSASDRRSCSHDGASGYAWRVFSIPG